MSVHFVNDAFESQFYHQSNKIRTNIHKYEHDAYTFLLKILFVSLHSDWNVISLLTDTLKIHTWRRAEWKLSMFIFKINYWTIVWPETGLSDVLLYVANSRNIFFLIQM